VIEPELADRWLGHLRPSGEDGRAFNVTHEGFSCLDEADPHDEHVIVIVDSDEYQDRHAALTHQQHGAKIVVLVREAEILELSPDEIAALSGALTWDLSTGAFVQSLRLICSGERVLPRDLPGRRLPAPTDIEPQPGGYHLSPREREVLLQVVEGHPNKVIARHLHIAEATVKVHLKSLQRKIRVSNRTQAAIWALANLSELSPSLRGSASAG
jgi:two-component system nitrate/nitrite response regulator NarL